MTGHEIRGEELYPHIEILPVDMDSSELNEQVVEYKLTENRDAIYRYIAELIPEAAPAPNDPENLDRRFGIRSAGDIRPIMIPVRHEHYPPFDLWFDPLGISGPGNNVLYGELSTGQAMPPHITKIIDDYNGMIGTIREEPTTIDRFMPIVDLTMLGVVVECEDWRSIAILKENGDNDVELRVATVASDSLANGHRREVSLWLANHLIEAEITDRRPAPLDESLDDDAIDDESEN